VGTLKKDWLGIAAPGQKYAVEAVDIFRVQDGKLAEHREKKEERE